MRTRERDETQAAWTRASRADAQIARAGGDAPLTAAGAVQAPPLDADAEPHGSLRRYLKFQLKDFLRERGSWMLALGGAVVALFRASYDPTSVAHIVRPSISEPEYFREHLINTFAPMAFFGVLIATHAIVSRDRDRGFQRFLFAKPIGAARYYLQSFLVNGAGFLGVGAFLLACTAAAFARGVPAAGMLAVAAGAYAALGGLTFLLSTLVRYDVALTVLVTLVAFAVDQIAYYGNGGWSTVCRLLSWLLPPVKSLGQATEAVWEGRTLAAIGFTLQPLAYGAAYVAAALAVIRRRSIAN